MRNGLLLLAAATVVLVSGCRIKSWESFESATTPNPPGEWKGDPYASAGIAGASGGRITGTRAAEGAKNNQTQGLTTTYGNPGKGTGLQPGEQTVSNRDAHGNQNAPAFEESPSSTQSPSARTGR